MDKRIIPLFVIVLLIPQLSFSYCADYGENSTALGQVTDEYLNDDYVNATYNVIRNNTRTCMELNSSFGGTYENFSTYVKLGSDAGKVAVTDTRLTWSNLRRDDQVYLYRDFGVNYFDGVFSFDFDINLSDVDAGDATNRAFIDLVVLDNVVGTAPSQGVNKITVRLKQNAGVNDVWVFRLGVGGNVDDVGIWNVGVDYYCTLSRNVGGDVRLAIYSDSDRLILISNIGSFSSFIDFRYLLVVVSHENVADGADLSSGYIEKLAIGGTGFSYETDGSYYTEDMMSGLDGGTLVHLTNVSLPTNTMVTVEYSNDNVTWKDHLNQAGSDTLIAGYYALDMRNLNYTILYQRFNLSTTDTTVTPRIYQNRIVTTYASVTTGGGGLFYPLVVWGIIVIFLITIGLVLNKGRR